ncbi:hypothetical protein ACFVWF_19395 [Rhodococcus qingshengii]|uniref:hypothetical protein n=1 Tax=Rhodococcus qingshengii TaxID=334542 RepID=UPI0036D7D05E
MFEINTELSLEIKIEREELGLNPNDRRQATDRWNATWGKQRVVETGSLYEMHYAEAVEAYGPVIEYQSVSQKDQTIRNAKRWANKKYASLDQDDISQEIELKAYLLEDHELNDRGEWERPRYVMMSLQNAVNDYARKEIGYSSANKISGEVIMSTRFDAPPADYDIAFTNKTLKAALLLFVAAPYTLSVGTKDVVYSIYRQLTPAEHKALLQSVVIPNDSATRALDRLVKKNLDAANDCTG